MFQIEMHSLKSSAVIEDVHCQVDVERDRINRILTDWRTRCFAKLRCTVTVCSILLYVMASVGRGVAQDQAGDGVPTSAAKGSAVTQEVNHDAMQGDALYVNYRFRDGATLPRLRIHYATLGQPHRNANGDINNAVLMLHWTGASGAALLTPDYMHALFDPGRPLDARRYYLIFPDSVGHGRSSKPSDGLRAGFPSYTYGDMVDLQHRLVTETLHIKHLRAILGMSMGGMNTWQWAEAYPDMMDGAMPVDSMPIAISGRNLLWRRMAIDDIRTDPAWNGGNYTKPPGGFLDAFILLRMMLDGVPHLQAIIPDSSGADAFIADARDRAAAADANDILYVLNSSADYNPQPLLGSIRAKLYALNFSDDEIDPGVLHVLDNLIPTVRQGRFFIQPGTPSSYGHLTMAHPDLWAPHVGEFMRELGMEPPLMR